jgi:ABC-type anion transport system duplicated permease subunit
MSEKPEDKYVCEACAFMTFIFMKNIWNTIVKVYLTFEAIPCIVVSEMSRRYPVNTILGASIWGGNY